MPVPMPRTYEELQHIASQLFGHDGCMRLYHQGSSLIYHPTQLSKVCDGDFVLVSRIDHRPHTPQDSPKVFASTFQSSFRRHPCQPQKRGVGFDQDSCLADRMKIGTMQSMSRYAADFIQHPASPRQPFKPPSALRLSDEPTGVSTYSREFHLPPHANDKPCVDRMQLQQTSILMASPRCKIETGTLYSASFKRSPMSPREAIPPVYSATSVKPFPSAFDPYTTYRSTFQVCNSPRQKSMRPAQGSNVPMDCQVPIGTSEYRQEFQEQNLEWA